MKPSLDPEWSQLVWPGHIAADLIGNLVTQTVDSRPAEWAVLCPVTRKAQPASARICRCPHAAVRRPRLEDEV